MNPDFPFRYVGEPTPGYATLWLLGLLLILAIVAGLAFLWHQMKAQGFGNLPQTARYPGDRAAAERELQRRYERGELSRNQYEAMLQELDQAA